MFYVTDASNEADSEEENMPIPQVRAKRNRTRPRYLKDYVLGKYPIKK